MKGTSFISTFILIIITTLLFQPTDVAAERDSRRKQIRENRLTPSKQVKKYKHNIQTKKTYKHPSLKHIKHSYLRHGHIVDRIPLRHIPIHFNKMNFYFQHGIWYRNLGSRFVVVAPPIGIVVSTLPAFYTTLRFNHRHYYYANDVYYIRRPDTNDYIVTEAPTESVNPDSIIQSNELFIYPENGQDEQQQAADKYECHLWGVNQTNYAPSKTPETNINYDPVREDYQRAITACLEGKNYSVR